MQPQGPTPQSEVFAGVKNILTVFRALPIVLRTHCPTCFLRTAYDEPAVEEL